MLFVVIVENYRLYLLLIHYMYDINTHMERERRRGEKRRGKEREDEKGRGEERIEENR